MNIVCKINMENSNYIFLMKYDGEIEENTKQDYKIG